MSSQPRVVAIALACFAAAPAAAAPSLDQDRAAVVRAAVEHITPSIVTIETIGGVQPRAEGAAPPPPTATQPQRPRRRGNDPSFRVADGPTTGLIWSSDGLIITSSFNFVRNPSVITVILADGRRFVAKLLARDSIRRLALLKIDAADLPAATWAVPAEIHVGEYAIACGRGFGGAAPSISVGIVSALGRRSGNAVQTDAKLSPANYGGPLIDIDGRVIGVCVPMAGGGGELAGVEWYDSGIGFGVRAEIVAARVERLRAGRDLLRGVMGVNLEQADPVVGDNAEPGIAIRGILQPGPAEAAGLREGDRITGLDGVETPRLIDLRRALATRVRGDEVEVAYLRDGKSATVRIALVDPAETGPPREPATQPGASQPATSQPTASQPGA